MTTPDPTTLGLLATTITGLSTANGVLWRNTMKHIEKVEQKLDECEEDRKDLWMVIANQCGKDVSELKRKENK